MQLPPHFNVYLSINILIAIFITSCSFEPPLLYDVNLQPHTTISPNGDGIEDVTILNYSIGYPALISITIESENGEVFFWRDSERRVANNYQAYFSGVINGKILENGRYMLHIIAESPQGDEETKVSLPITIIEGDTQPPEILGLEVTPLYVSPNRDGINDEIVITYSLSKPMAQVEVYLLDSLGKRHPLPPDLIRDPLEEGSHLHRYDGGVGLGAVPPPDGQYSLILKATDTIGASDLVSTTVYLENGGLPLVQITRHAVEFSSTVLSIGDTLFFTTSVTNVGLTPIRTHGAEPGIVFDSTTNYNNFEDPISDGAWRLGVDFEGNRVYNGQSYPYRWQLGRTHELEEIDGELYLMPGHEVTITGGIKLLEMPPRVETAFWIGLLHENVRIVEDRVGTEYIVIETDKSFPSTTGTPNNIP